jgi:hypothetical protein
MNRPSIEYCRKETIYPAYGKAYPEEGKAYVRKDLPRPVQQFVESHERYHLADPSRWWLWREIRANWHAAWKHPIGFGICVLMSFKPSRLLYYAGRFRSGS